jgi:non-heme chloroperoxidase
LGYIVDQFGGSRISDQGGRTASSPPSRRRATPAHAGVDTWLTDSRGDLPKINVRTLLVRGDADRILPYEATAKRLRDLLRSTPLPGISTQSLQRARRSC